MAKRKQQKLTIEQRCAAQHFGPWMIEGRWFAQAWAAVKAGTFKPEGAGNNQPQAMEDPNVVGEMCGEVWKVRYYIDGDIGRIPFSGQVVKGNSSFGGASSVWTRQSLRMAAEDDRVNCILLHIDSPGGTVAGTGDLAADVAAIDKIKPVYGYVEDLCASAAYWIASQCRAIFSNPTAEIGSIGTMTYLYDTSGMYEKEGVKAILVSTGKYKGAWVDGLPVSDDYVKTIQTEVDDLNEHFLAGVMAGRDMSREQLASIADGRVFIASKAKQMGLIDGIMTIDEVEALISQETMRPGEPWDEVVGRMRARLNQTTVGQRAETASEDAGTSTANSEEIPMNVEQIHAFADANPAAVAKYVEQGKKAGAYEARASELARAKAVREACAGNDALAFDLFLAGKEADDAKIAVDAAAKARADADAKAATAKAETDAKIEAQNKEIEKLKATIGEQGAVGTSAAAAAGNKADAKAPEKPTTNDAKELATWAKAAAAHEWDTNPDTHKGFSSKANFIAFRAAELSGKVRVTK